MITFCCMSPEGQKMIRWYPGEPLPTLPGRLYTLEADGDEAAIIMLLLRRHETAMNRSKKLSKRPEPPVGICPICHHTPDTPGICNCECHPPDSIAGQFKRQSGGMSAAEFMNSVEFRKFGGTK